MILSYHNIEVCQVAKSLKNGCDIMTKRIPLSEQGKHKGKFFAVVDDGDFESLSQYRWCVAATYTAKKRVIMYAARQIRIDGKQRLLYMHDEIMGHTGRDKVVDHIDWDGLNNTRGNLRITTSSENKLNTYH